MRYPVVIHKDPDSDYGVTVPDLPGCFTAGDTIDEALAMAQEAIETHLEGMIIAGESVPQTSSVEYHKNNPDYAGGIWALVEVNLSQLSGKTRRVNITLPERIVTMMDRYAAQHGETRSGLITRAAMEFIAAHTLTDSG